MSNTVVTVGQLIKQDLEKAYFFPLLPSSYCKNSRFLNNEKYHVYDYPPWSVTFREIVFPQAFSCTAGDEIPVLTDHPPPDFLRQHWKTWLPTFPPARFVSVDEGLKDDLPIVTTGAFQGIPRSKHSVDTDILRLVQSKSCIPEIGVPCPHYMDEKNVEFPCVVKVDMSHFSHAIFKANNRDELVDLIKEIREKRGWNGKIIYQELIQGIKEVPGYIFYLTKTGKVVWIGTTKSTFHEFKWVSLTCDWNYQEEERERIYDEFVIPISEYLHVNGYFGLVSFELVVNEQGRYLVDLNPRLPGDCMHNLMAPYMASMDMTFSLHSFQYTNNQSSKTATKQLVENANILNQSQDGRIIICSAADNDENNYQYVISIFGKTKEDCQTLFEKLKRMNPV